MPPLAITRPKMLPSPLGDGVGHSNHDRFRGYLSVHLRSGLQFPCLRFATAVTGRHARLGTRLLARLCRGCHFRRLCLTSFQGATPTDPDVRVLPHPAPRQMASLRAVAYPLVQEARRWPPPSPRLIWPVRLSGVVTWRRDPTSVCWPSFPPPVPPAGAPFPPRGRVGSIPPLRRYSETRRLLAVHPPALRCLRPAVPSEHLRLRSVGLDWFTESLVIRGAQTRQRGSPPCRRPGRREAVPSGVFKPYAGGSLSAGRTSPPSAAYKVCTPSLCRDVATEAARPAPLEEGVRVPSSGPGPHEAHRQDPHLPMRYDTGRPRAVIRLRISQPRTTSLPCQVGLRARRPSPMMGLYRKNAFSTRP